jgi:hypothetical protein
MNNLVLNTKLSLDDYIRVNIYLLYRKLMIRCLTAVGALILLGLLYYQESFIFFPWLPFLMGLYLVISFPLTTYFIAKRNYKSTSKIGEHISYEFNNDYLEMIGESFQARLTWDKIYRITETKNWLLIWKTPHIADIVAKRYFTEGTLNTFKGIVAQHPYIKNKFR